MYSKNLQHLINCMRKEGYDACEIICNPGRNPYYSFVSNEFLYFPHKIEFGSQDEIRQFIKDCRHNSRF